MRYFRAMMQSSMLRFSIFLVSAIVLVHFDIPKTALAIPGPPGPPPPPGPNYRFPTPLKCDYPDDDTIRSDFLGTDLDGTVDFADLDTPSNYQVPAFCFLYGAKWIDDAFPADYIFKGGRSDRWYQDFYYRLSVIFLQQARGWVYLLSRAEGPRPSRDECRFWFYAQFPTLRATEAVDGIVVVNVEDFDDQWLYWERGDGDQPRQRPEPGGDGNGDDGNGNGRGGDGNGNGNGRNGNRQGGDLTEWNGGNADGNGGSVWNALTGALGTGLIRLQTTAAGFGAAGLEAWRAVMGGRKHPSMPAGDPNHRMDQPDPGIKTDVLNLKIGELPDIPGGMDETSTVAAIDPTSGADGFEANDETSREEEPGIGGVLNTDGIGGISNTATSLGLFGRGHRMHSRTVYGSCNGDNWVADPWNPDFPGYTGMSGRPKDASRPASSYGALYPFAPGALATLLITQYGKRFDSQRQSSDYHLDITILDPAGKVIFTQKQIDAPSRQEITVDAGLNFLLHVKVADEKDGPISFRYGDPLILNVVNGVKWDSNDKSQDHRCATDPAGLWEDKRQIMCMFKN